MKSTLDTTKFKSRDNYLQQGSKLLADGKLEEAKQVYLEAINSLTDSAELYQQLGRSCLELQQWQEATKYFALALRLKPNHYWSYLNLGDAFAKQHQWQSALKNYEEALKIKPELPLTYRKLSAVFLEAKQWQQAVDILKKAIAIEPDFPWNYYNLGKAFFDFQQYQLAVTNYLKFIALEPDFWEGYFRLGETYEQLHDYTAATDTYLKSIELNPDFPWHYFHLGNLYLEDLNFNDAITCYQKFTNIKQDFWQGYHQLGESFFALGKWQSAVVAYRKSLNLNDQFFWSYYNLGSSLLNLGEETAAINHWQKALKLDPSYTKAYIKIIDLLLSHDELLEAKKWLDLGLANCYDDVQLLRDLATSEALGDREQLLKQNSATVVTPESITPNLQRELTTDNSKDNFAQAGEQFELGKTLARQEKWQSALEALQRAVKSSPHDPWIHCEIGLCLFKLEQYNSAEQAFYSALQHNPDSSWLHNCLGKVFFTQQKWQAAADTYSKAAALEPDNFWHYDQLADACYYLNQWEQAADAYKRASTFYPDNSTIYHRLGKALIELQQWQDAKIALEKAIAITPETIEYHEDLISLLQHQGTPEALTQASQQKEIYQIITSSRRRIHLNRNDFDAHKNLADASLEIERWDEAAAAYKYVLQLKPASPEVYSNLAIALHQQGKWQAAEQAYRHAIECHPERFWLYSSLAAVCSQLGKWQSAADAYKRAIQLKSDNCWLYNNLGEVLAKQNCWQEAISAYNQAVKLNPHNSWLWICLGNTQIKLQNWHQALIAYQNARQLEPNNFWQYDKLGDCFFNLDQWESAVECYRTAFANSKHLSWSYKLSFVAWSYHELGNKLRQQNKWQAAEQAYRQAIELNGDLPWHYFYLGETLERQYKPLEALTAYRRAAELNSHSPWFQQDESRALSHMQGKGLVICIYTCAKYQNQQQAIRDTWLKEVIKRDIPYYFVIGKPGAKSYVDGDILYVDAPDTYEHLPHKTYKFIEYIHNYTFYSHVFKIDDDCYVNLDRLLECNFEQYDYMGKVTGHAEINRSWHIGKTDNPNIGEYQGKLKGTWADGASGYFLNRHAMQKLLEYDNYQEIAAELYEDKMVGDLLRTSGIQPVASQQYKIGVERQDRYTDHKLGFAPWHETPYPHKSNDLVLFHSDAAPDIQYRIHKNYEQDNIKHRQFLRKPYWWKGHPHNTICLERIDSKEINLKTDDVLCFLVVRNESLRLPYLLSYYRDRGIKYFFVVDNHSTDETFDYLQQQPDVYLWHTTRSYGKSRWGVDWIELLLQNYGVNHWCLLVDADELLYYPDCENKDIHQLCQELERENKRAFTTVLLDMYSKVPIQKACYSQGQNFLNTCAYFDRKFYTVKANSAGPFKNQTGYWGGLRQRIFKNMEHPSGNRLYCLNKVPLIKYDYSIKLCEGFHWIDNVEFASQTGCLLHFKYFSTFHERAKEEIKRGEHWNGASEYAQYALQLDENPNLSFYEAEHSLNFQNSQQLLNLGIIKSHK